MPWIDNSRNDPSFPYGYVTKPKYKRSWQAKYSDGTVVWKSEMVSRPRLPPWYFDKGYEFYKERMDPFMEMYRPKPQAYRNPNTGKIFYKTPAFNPDSPDVPVYYTYLQFKKKAEKYARQRRQQVLIRKRIEANKQKALAKRRRLKLIKEGFIR